MPRKKKPKNAKWQKLNTASLTIGRFLLDQLLELGEIFPRPFETPYTYKRRLDGWPKEYGAHRVRQELKRMKDRGWIKEAHRQGKKFLQLTEKGRLHALYQKIGGLRMSLKRPWDGKWRLAIFDIPEEGRRERDAIRGILKIVGFYQLQKSVYLFPYEIPAGIIAYLKEANLLPYIRFIRADRLDNIEEIKKCFKL